VKSSRKIIFLLIFFFLAATAFAQERPRVAVMPFEAGNDISKPEAGYLTDLIRTGLIKNGKFDIISNDQLEQMLKTKQQKQQVGSGSCTSEKCIIDLGNALECEKMIVGGAAGAFGEFTINVKMLDVVKQKYDMAESVTIKNKNEFPDAARRIVFLLSGRTGQADVSMQKEKENKERIEKERLEKEEAEKQRIEEETLAKEKALQKQKALERIISLNQEKGVNRTGMLWRSLVVPGWGHYYTNLNRGFVYSGLWAGIGGAFLWSHMNYNSKNDAYNSATDSAKFDSLYNDSNSAYKLRGYLSFAFIGIYVAALSDIFLTGNRYILGNPVGATGQVQMNIYIGVSPETTAAYSDIPRAQLYHDEIVSFVVSWRY
jgi:hypothetical protein